MRNFSYRRNDEGVRLEAKGDLLEIAAEVGHMVRYIYTAVMKRDSDAAELFKAAVLVAIADPDSPTWDASAVNPDIAIFHCTEK